MSELAKEFNKRLVEARGELDSPTGYLSDAQSASIALDLLIEESERLATRPHPESTLKRKYPPFIKLDDLKCLVSEILK